MSCAGSAASNFTDAGASLRRRDQPGTSATANVRTLIDRYGVAPDRAEQPLLGDVLPSADKDYVSPGSSDMGDMSWYAPCSMLQTATWASRAAAHSWGVVATGRTSIGHKGMMYAAKVMAIAAAELVQSPNTLEKGASRIPRRPRANALRLSDSR